MKKLTIYQIKEEFSRNFGFFRYEFIKQQYGGVDFTQYKKAYECERNDEYTLEKAFEEFNINRPEDFTGHSMSVGDVVAFDNKIYYCDSFGFVTLFGE